VARSAEGVDAESDDAALGARASAEILTVEIGFIHVTTTPRRDACTHMCILMFNKQEVVVDAASSVPLAPLHRCAKAKDKLVEFTSDQRTVPK